MKHTISEKRYQILLRFEAYERRYRKIQADLGANLKERLITSQTEEYKSQHELRERGGCSPEFQKGLDTVNAQLNFENDLEKASKTMLLSELFDEAKSHGESYYQGFQDGFWKGRDALLDNLRARAEQSNELHKELLKKFGIDGGL